MFELEYYEQLTKKFCKKEKLPSAVELWLYQIICKAHITTQGWINVRLNTTSWVENRFRLRIELIQEEDFSSHLYRKLEALFFDHPSCAVQLRACVQATNKELTDRPSAIDKTLFISFYFAMADSPKPVSKKKPMNRAAA